MASKKKYELTSAVWVNGSEQLPVGTPITFDSDEPEGIFIGRVQEITGSGEAINVSTPAAEKSEAQLKKDAKAADKAKAEAEVPTPPAPPAAE